MAEGNYGKIMVYWITFLSIAWCCDEVLKIYSNCLEKSWKSLEFTFGIPAYTLNKHYIIWKTYHKQLDVILEWVSNNEMTPHTGFSTGHYSPSYKGFYGTIRLLLGPLETYGLF